ncbi:hypothetical protein LCGC14_0786890 [marine sediment metagenome]|uniref:Uncharacterized protein n=2 Tax=unclassified sequences TaxID=12908 RepID=A0A0F9PTX5_9ZZZZ|nr:MAG: hypothetical protein Lokiarch_10170 [Candidatus Lokiarchaeum sp. GC14_75]
MADFNTNTIKDENIESKLFALIHTILNAFQKFEEGLINDTFFRKTVKNAIKSLIKINFYLNEKRIKLSHLLNKMNFTSHYNDAITIINTITSKEISNISIENNFSESTQSSKEELSSILMELPGITLEITSSFITLMDALKLKGINEGELIIKMFKTLIKNVKRFPGNEEIHFNLKQIYKHVLSYMDREEGIDGFNEKIVDELYQIFKDFQRKLNLKR